MKFFYNELNKKQIGVCTCPLQKCSDRKKSARKGWGNGLFQCKIITFCVFESGKIVITGGRNMKQINATHIFFSDIIKKNASKFVLIQPLNHII